MFSNAEDEGFLRLRIEGFFWFESCFYAEGYRGDCGNACRVTLFLFMVDFRLPGVDR